jgi:hypothetical protein
MAETEVNAFLTHLAVERHMAASTRNQALGANWISAAVQVQAGGFRGSVGGHLRVEELVVFHDQFARSQASLRGTAEFSTMEGRLSIRAEGNGRGHSAFQCVLRDARGVGNTLHCTLATDQTFTRASLGELAAAVRAFPVVGR